MQYNLFTRIFALALITGLSACASSQQGFDKAHNELLKPSLERYTISMFINVSDKTNVEYQLTYLTSLMEDMGDVRKLYVRLTALPGGVYADEMNKTLSLIKRSMKKNGVRARHIFETHHGRPIGHLVNAPIPVEQGSTILVGVDKFVIIPPECNKKQGRVVAGREAHHVSDIIGCTNATNRAMMAASPVDITRGQDFELTGAEELGRIAAEYRRGEFESDAEGVDSRAVQ